MWVSSAARRPVASALPRLRAASVLGRSLLLFLLFLSVTTAVVAGSSSPSVRAANASLGKNHSEPPAAPSQPAAEPAHPPVHNSETSTSVRRLLALHGGLMILAWVGMVPFASLLARFRHGSLSQHVERRLQDWRGKDGSRVFSPEGAANWWLHVHRGVQLTAAWLMTGAAAGIGIYCVSQTHHSHADSPDAMKKHEMAMMNEEGGDDAPPAPSHFHHPHTQCGLAVLIFAFLNPILGQVADWMFQPDRTATPWFPDRIHAVLGWMLWTLSLVTIFLGTQSYDPSGNLSSIVGSVMVLEYLLTAGFIGWRWWRSRNGEERGASAGDSLIHLLTTKLGRGDPESAKRRKYFAIGVALFVAGVVVAVWIVKFGR